jgi:hypothetical protein
VALLPVVPELFRLSGAGGYFRRGWGAGWPLDGVHPVMSAQMVLFCDRDRTLLHWCARLAQTEESEARRLAGTRPQGQLRLAADTSQRTPHALKLTPQGPPVDVSQLGAPDARGGWLIQGKSTLACPGEGHYGLALYGYAPGLRVLWAAVTVTGQESKS